VLDAVQLRLVVLGGLVMACYEEMHGDRRFGSCLYLLSAFGQVIEQILD
jgi:hypothetical protein